MNPLVFSKEKGNALFEESKYFWTFDLIWQLMLGQLV